MTGARRADPAWPVRRVQDAFIIETVDERQRDWWYAEPGDDGPGGIEESHDSPETFAVAIMNRYLDHIHDHRDDYADRLMDEMHIRVSVWPVQSVTAAHPATAPDPDNYPPASWSTD
jgi:hypothetical protein